MMRAILLLPLLAVSAPGASAQSQAPTRADTPILRNPAILRRVDTAQTTQDDEDDAAAPVLTRRAYELAQEAAEAERRRAAGPRPRYYDVECGAVTELRLDVTDLRVTCERTDPYGQNYYILWLDVSAFPEQGAGTSEVRQWRAERLIEAVNMTRNDPNAHLTLKIGPLDLNGSSTVRDLSGYTIRYSD